MRFFVMICKGGYIRAATNSERSATMLNTLPREIAHIVRSFLTLDDTIVLVACASQKLHKFLPARQELDARTPNTTCSLWSERRRRPKHNHRAIPVLDTCVDRVGCVYHNPSLRHLLLTTPSYATIARAKLNATEALRHLDTDLVSRQRVAIEILEGELHRQQLNRFALAHVLTVALRLTLHDLVEWILLHAPIAMVPTRFCIDVMLSSCHYNVVSVGSRIIDEMLGFTPPSVEVLSHILAAAAQFGRLEIIRTAVKHLMFIDCLGNNTLESALAAAAQGGHREAIRLLLSTAESHDIVLDATEALACACRHRHQELVDMLLSSSIVTIANSGHPTSPLAAAVEGSVPDIVTTILADPRVNAWDARAFQRAVGNGNATVVKQLLRHESCRTTDVDSALRSIARTSTHKDVVRVLVTHQCPRQEELWEMVDIVCSHGDIDVIEHVLSACGTGNDTLDRKYWRPLVTAARHGHAHVVHLILEGHGLWHILSMDTSLDSHAEMAEALLAACHRGHRAAAEKLLPFVSIDMIQLLRIVEAAAAAPSSGVLEWLLSSHDAITSQCDLDAALQYACAHGRGDAARLLLNHSRVRFADGLPIQFAATCGAMDLVALLLADSRVTEQYDLEAALIDAAREGHGMVVELLLADARLRITSGTALHEAADRGHLEVLKLLMHSPIVWRDPTILDVEVAYARAAAHAHYAILFVLLNDPRVPLPLDGAVTRVDALPKRPGDAAWCTFLRRFFRHPRIDPTADDNQLLLDACLHAKRGVVDSLLRSGRVTLGEMTVEAVDDLVRLVAAPLTNRMPRGLARRYRLLAEDLQRHRDRVKHR